MNTIHNMKPGELSFEDVERVIQHARRMRSQALADMGTTLRAFLKHRTHCALLHIRAAVSRNHAEKCA
jgi:hypothetical protein